MNRDVIPFIPTNFGSFIGLIVIFGVLGVIIHTVQLYQTWCCQVFMALASQKTRNRNIRGLRLRILQSSKDSLLGDEV